MTSRKLTRRGSERREQILEAAYRLFAEQGYHGTTVGDICDELGVGKGVFYWYFTSKDTLFKELLRSCLFQLRKSQQAAIQGVANPVDRIERGIRASIDFYRSDPGYLGLFRTAARYEDFAGVLQEGQQIVMADTAIHIKEGWPRARSAMATPTSCHTGSSERSITSSRRTSGPMRGPSTTGLNWRTRRFGCSPRRDPRSGQLSARRAGHWLPRRDPRSGQLSARRAGHWLPRRDPRSGQLSARRAGHWLPRRDPRSGS